MNRNPSYIFFQLSSKSPTGSLGVPVTAGRSLALDHGVFPSAALAYVTTAKPLVDAGGHIARWESLQRFMLNQDRGGAIRGPGRADFYWGGGDFAQAAAGHMKHPGQLYFLILKPAS
jgi:membrane-bound lytic murein transglycosylase A